MTTRALSRITANQRAQLARAIEQARAQRARNDRRQRALARQTINDRHQREAELAEQLLEHIAHDSTIDRATHAIGVARMILQSRQPSQ